jgi:hypothetical protein
VEFGIDLQRKVEEVVSESRDRHNGQIDHQALVREHETVEFFEPQTTPKRLLQEFQAAGQVRHSVDYGDFAKAAEIRLLDVIPSARQDASLGAKVPARQA